MIDANYINGQIELYEKLTIFEVWNICQKSNAFNYLQLEGLNDIKPFINTDKLPW